MVILPKLLHNILRQLCATIANSKEAKRELHLSRGIGYGFVRPEWACYSPLSELFDGLRLPKVVGPVNDKTSIRNRHKKALRFARVPCNHVDWGC